MFYIYLAAIYLLKVNYRNPLMICNFPLMSPASVFCAPHTTFFHFEPIKVIKSILANICLFKVNNRNTRKRCKICVKLTIKPPEQRHWRPSGVFIVKFEHISDLFLVFLSLLWINFCWKIALYYNMRSLFQQQQNQHKKPEKDFYLFYGINISFCLFSELLVQPKYSNFPTLCKSLRA